MKLIEFPEQTDVIAKDQPQYLPMPAYVNREDDKRRVICLWQLTMGERLRVLIRGQIWHHILTYGNSVQPQLLQTTSPFTGK